MQHFRAMMQAAEKDGATREEILEVCGVAIAMGGGPSYTYTVPARREWTPFRRKNEGAGEGFLRNFAPRAGLKGYTVKAWRRRGRRSPAALAGRAHRRKKKSTVRGLANR